VVKSLRVRHDSPLLRGQQIPGTAEVFASGNRPPSAAVLSDATHREREEVGYRVLLQEPDVFVQCRSCWRRTDCSVRGRSGASEARSKTGVAAHGRARRGGWAMPRSRGQHPLLDSTRMCLR